jgi:hypothetical protein
VSGASQAIAAVLWRWAAAAEVAGSVVLSHPASCCCAVCRAARGDEDALALVVEGIAAIEGRR